MNPVPLWPDKDKWYCRKPTNHGACAHPVLPKGLLPAMMLTVPSQESVTSYGTRVVATLGRNTGASMEFIGSIDDRIDVNSGRLTFNIEDYAISIEPVNDDGYNILLTPWHSESILLMNNGNEVVTAQELISGVELWSVQIEDYSYYMSLTTKMIKSTALRWRLYRLDGDTPVHSFNSKYAVILVPSAYRTATRYATLFVEETPVVGTFDDGVYYLAATDNDGIIHYSEPFLWLSNLERHLLVTYRRSTPVVTAENYLPFNVEGTTKALSMYLPGRLMMPPFKFDVDVEEIDGMRYARKQVSYSQERVEFYCTSYFAQAIRLLWHCDIRYVRLQRVDYMEPPQVDWKDDNHLCNVVLEFQCDTVMQTNGTASAYDDSSDSSHSTYDSSFDQSFG